MALLEEWILPGPVETALSARIEDVLRALLPAPLERSVRLDDGTLVVLVRVPRGDLEALALRLDEPLDHFDGWDWRDEIDDLEEGGTYALRVECASKTPETFGASEEELPVLSVYSKDGDNLAAWPVAFVLAARLAHEVGAWEPEENADVLN
jgi:hypothetical protein